jgi:ribosomal protein S18 acetylase RimI-like enzyme
LNPPAPPVTLRRLQPHDLGFVVEQHLRHFPNGFFARLGRPFLEEYDRSYCTNPETCAIVADCDGTPVGYLVGTVAPVEHRQHVYRMHGLALVRRASIALLRQPRLLAAFLRTRSVRYGKKIFRQLGRTHDTAATAAHRTAVLNHVVVRSTSQGQGVGSLLIDELVTAARRNGVTEVMLVTETGGHGAAYYRSTGWAAVDEHATPEGLRLTTFVKAVADDSPSAGPDTNKV